MRLLLTLRYHLIKSIFNPLGLDFVLVVVGDLYDLLLNHVRVELGDLLCQLHFVLALGIFEVRCLGHLLDLLVRMLLLLTLKYDFGGFFMLTQFALQSLLPE